MHDFRYVPRDEWKPVRDELVEIIHTLQNEVRDEFTFQYRFVGSSRRNMITRDYKSNKGFDFDVNLEVNDPDDNYSPAEIRNILRKGLDKVIKPCGRSIFGYDYTEDSTRVLTIKVKDSANSLILHSCDFCVVYECEDGQQYIRYNKEQNTYTWDNQRKGYEELPAKIEWVKNCGLWQCVRDRYIDKKNMNDNPDKHSRAIFAETVHEIWQKNRNKMD